ncbi:hypothetical protein [Methanobrevibacter sp. DSM 116169]|uniref:hypothetical protein n=1 Tax=Methanobrevibacter sp. DSM 116169 TaxID=3242727 RepID=UPI0038FC6AC9
MKFKYCGENGFKSIELAAYRLVGTDKVFNKGDIVNVSNKYDVVINGLKASGVWEQISDSGTKKVEKDEKKGDKK